MAATTSSAGMVRLKPDATYGDGTWRPPLGGPSIAASVNASSAHTSVIFDRDLGAHVRPPVIGVLERVAHFELTDGHRHPEREIQRPRQPDVPGLGEGVQPRHR